MMACSLRVSLRMGPYTVASGGTCWLRFWVYTPASSDRALAADDRVLVCRRPVTTAELVSRDQMVARDWSQVTSTAGVGSR